MNCKLLFPALAMVALASCTVQRLNYKEASTRLIEPNQGALITPLIADMELISEEKITPYVEVFNEEVTYQILPRIDGYKKTALLNAAKKYGADVIVAATFEVETTANQKLQITVTGFPAKYVNFRKATPEDSWMVGMHEVINQGNVTPVLLNKQK